jgi:DNA-binding LytR/AlgR family response regulator
MSISQSFASHFTFGLQPREISTSIVGWGGYMIVLACYCTVYQVVLDLRPDFVGSFIWVAREWIVWLLISPLVFKALRSSRINARNRYASYVFVGATVLLATLTFRVAVDVLWDMRGMAESVMIFLPRYIAASVVVLLLGHLYAVRQAAATSLTPTPVSMPANSHHSIPAVANLAPDISSSFNPNLNPNPEPVTDHLISKKVEHKRLEHPSVILVSKGNDECLIQVRDVECIIAARNYVEICTGGDQLYLLRMTMNDVQELLPATDFVRIHRSHIVNINAIDRIKRQASGNDMVCLRSGRLLNIGRKFKDVLEQFRLEAVN